MKNYAQTGFQSACSEFSQNSLSLDDYFSVRQLSRKLVRIQEEVPLLGITQGDLLLIDMSEPPSLGDIVFASNSSYNGIYRFEFHKGHPVLWPGRMPLVQDDSFILAPVILIIRELLPLTVARSLRSDPSYLNNERQQDSLMRWKRIKAK